MHDELQARIEQALLRRQLPSGGWSFYPRSSQAALEPSALGLLALGGSPAEAGSRARKFLVRLQNPDGSWPAFVGDREGAWTTSLTLLALQPFYETAPQRLRGLSWLLENAGREAHWFWKWKFRTTDRHVAFDPNKFGWPWTPGTVSWVVPTALAIVALRNAPCACGLENPEGRIRLGREMLLDRACPGGGWNAGNGVVYDSRLAPHADATAIALLAFVDAGPSSVVETALAWLETLVPSLSSPWSVAWAILALAAHRRPLKTSLDQLAELAGEDQALDGATLGAVHLACSASRGTNPFASVL